MSHTQPIHLGDERVGTSVVATFHDSGRQVVLPIRAAAALRDAAHEAAAAAAGGGAYGRTTGVGANRNVAADDTDGGHGQRLVRSHATAAGPDLGEAVARASMLVRAHQLSAPGSGIPVEVVEALVQAINDGRSPLVRTFASVGTGDIAPLAELALCLLGERPWRDDRTARYLQHLDASAALAFMSSSATTIATAAVAVHQLARLVDASLVVAALGTLAISANREQWSPTAAATRPSAGVDHVCSVFRRLTDGARYEKPRTQDPLSWRCIPFIAGPLVEVLAEAVAEIDGAIDARAENPRYDAGSVFHHGSFNLTSLGLRLDTLRLALTQWASSSVARTVKLDDPAYSGQRPFLADGPAGSSGVMVLEYTAGSALETVRTLADPTSRHTLTISIGTEDHASHATRGAVATLETIDALRTVVACELVTAVRALRSSTTDIGDAAREVLATCASLPTATTDRPLVDDLVIAGELLPRLATFAAA